MLALAVHRLASRFGGWTTDFSKFVLSVRFPQTTLFIRANTAIQAYLRFVQESLATIHQPPTSVRRISPAINGLGTAGCELHEGNLRPSFFAPRLETTGRDNAHLLCSV